jgi:hydrogenase expression/formation protein HypE
MDVGTSVGVGVAAGVGVGVAAGEDQILLAHGSGGSMMHELIESMFFNAYGSDILMCADDAATLLLPDATASLAFSTDSFVVTPHFFPGGDIGRLAVCGTVNDVATSGAQPRWLSIAFVLEEGFPLADLRRICASVATSAREAGVQIVTGDTKVVNRGCGDGIYLNTSGVGVLAAGLELSGAQCKPGDRILLSGTLGDHGIAIISCRENLSFSTTVKSDAAPLNHLIAAVLKAAPQVRCFRDPTRGGLASTLNELAEQSNTVITIDEDAVPVCDQVRGACDLLGYDVFQVANEGKMVCVVPSNQADAALVAMRASRYGADAAIIGEVSAPRTDDQSPRAYVRTAFGARRILDMLVGEQLPRIC